MRKWRVIYASIPTWYISAEMIQNVRFYAKWSNSDIAYIEPKHLIQCITVQKVHRAHKYV